MTRTLAARVLRLDGRGQVKAAPGKWRACSLCPRDQAREVRRPPERWWRTAIVLACPLMYGLAPGAAAAGPLFVAKTGSDANSGTLGAPWRTISASLGKLRAGDTLYVRGGSYYEAPVAATGGTAAAPIVVRSYPGETVTIDAGYPEFQKPGNADWELVDGSTGEYRSRRACSAGNIYGYLAGIPGYENERVALVPYQSAAHFRATTDRYNPVAFYVGPGTFHDPDGRIHIRLAKTGDMRAAEARYGWVLADENANPSRYSIILSQASHTLRVTGSYIAFKDLTLHQAQNTISLGANTHHLRFEGITAWMGDRSIEATESNIHDVTVTQSRLYGDVPYWIFWSDMKDPPAPANLMRGTSLNLGGGAHDWEISYNHIRGSGQDLIGTNTSEYNISIHHNRLENAGDDALELEGTIDVGRIQVYENFIANCFTAVAPGQDTPVFSGPLLVYRNVMSLLRNPPVNREAGLHKWNGGGRFGYEYLLKQRGSGFGTRNTHYYHNTMVLLNSGGRGIGLTPEFPADTRCVDNLVVTVNGPVNGDYLRGPGQVVNGNLYWKINTVDDAPLLGGYNDVTAFSRSTGLEMEGIGDTPKRGSDPELAWHLQIVDPSLPVWELTPASERSSMIDFFLGALSPARDAGIAVPSHPTLGLLPDSRLSRDIGAIPFDSSAEEYQMFPFEPSARSPVNRAPRVDAGPDLSVRLPREIGLGGAVLDDGLPVPAGLGIQWTKVSGPGPVSFSNPGQANTRASFLVAGAYRLCLTAADGLVATSDTARVSVLPAIITTIERRVTASDDDAEESAAGVVSLSSSDLELMLDHSPQEGVGLRFGGLEIPPGATVVNAYVQFRADEAQSEPTDLIIRGQASDDVSGFSAARANDISMRPRTAAAVKWTPAPWMAIGSEERTPDLAPVIQEIVSRPGWKSGNSLAILINGIGHRTAGSYDGDRAGAPLLHVALKEAGVATGVGGGPPAPPAPDSTRLQAVVVSVTPNPLRDRGALHFTTQHAGPVRIQLFDVSGRRVQNLEDSSNIPAGSHSIELSPRGRDGERLPAGVVFYRVEAAGAMCTGRFLILN